MPKAEALRGLGFLKPKFQAKDSPVKKGEFLLNENYGIPRAWVPLGF